MKLPVLTLAMAAVLAAQTTSKDVQVEPLKEVQLQPRVGVLGQTTIGLQEVIQRVLANDKDLQVSRILREEAGYNVVAAQGYYDPVLGLRSYYGKSVIPFASIIGGGPNGKLTTTEFNATPQLSGLTSTGGNYSINFSNARQTSNSQFVTLNPQFPSNLSLDLTQPLWRGLRFDENRHRIQVATSNEQLSAEQLRQRVIEIVTQAILAYSELQYAWQNYQVQSEAVRLAEQQYNSNRRQAEQGVLAPIDVVAAQTQVATFQQNVFLAQQALTQAENNLKQFMLPNRDDLMWSTALVPDAQPDTSINLPDLNEALKQALADRPELKANAITAEINRLNTRLAYEQAKPRIDAFAHVALAGLAGTPLPVGPNPLTAGTDALVGRLNQLSALAGLQPIPGISFGGGSVPPLLDGGYMQSLSGLVRGNFPVAQAGIQISLPLRNRTATAQAKISEAEGRRVQAVREQIAMAVEADVRNSLQIVASARSRLEAAALTRRSAEEQYSSEQRQFQAGTSTVFLVLQRQTDLIAARSREVRAQTDVAEAKANFERATASTIEARNIRVL